MHARVTRYTDCDAESIARVVSEMGARDEPPPGVEVTAFKLLVDENAGTMLFVGFFEDEEKLRAADEALKSMDPPGGVPGKRASVDLCEVKVERDR